MSKFFRALNVVKKFKERKTMMEKRDRTKERDDRVVPVVRKIFKLLAEKEDIKFLEQKNKQEVVEYYDDLYKEVIVIMQTEGICISDIKYVFTLLRTPISLLQERVELQLDRHQQNLQSMIYRNDDLDSVTIADLDKAIKEFKQANDEAAELPQEEEE